MAMTGAERTRKYRQNHPENLIRDKTTGHERNVRLKAQVLTHYGNGKLACVICGESRIACLSIDHIDGGGCKQRYHTALRSSTSFYNWLIKQGFPAGYQTLCMNCQFVKRADRGEERRGRDTDDILHGKPILWRDMPQVICETGADVL